MPMLWYFHLCERDSLLYLHLDGEVMYEKGAIVGVRAATNKPYFLKVSIIMYIIIVKPNCMTIVRRILKR